MKILIIFVLFINIGYANNTNLKNLKHGCNYFPKTYVDEPSVFENFNIMKLIPLSQKSKTIAGKYFAMVDDEDYDRLSKFTWHLRKNNSIKDGTVYACTKGINNVTGKRCNILMHRMIMGLSDPSVLIDHQDTNGLNNQKYNLREATSLQNSRNKNKSSGKSSKYLGVNINNTKSRYTCKDGTVTNKVYSKWIATIRVNGKLIYLGRYTEQEPAARAYDKAAKKYFGEFANLNFKI